MNIQQRQLWQGAWWLPVRREISRSNSCKKPRKSSSFAPARPRPCACSAPSDTMVMLLFSDACGKPAWPAALAFIVLCVGLPPRADTRRFSQGLSGARQAPVSGCFASPVVGATRWLASSTFARAEAACLYEVHSASSSARSACDQQQRHVCHVRVWHTRRIK